MTVSLTPHCLQLFANPTSARLDMAARLTSSAMVSWCFKHLHESIKNDYTHDDTQCYLYLAACPNQCSTCAIAGGTSSDDTLICSVCKTGYEENSDVCSSKVSLHLKPMIVKCSHYWLILTTSVSTYQSAHPTARPALMSLAAWPAQSATLAMPWTTARPVSVSGSLEHLQCLLVL